MTTFQTIDTTLLTNVTGGIGRPQPTQQPQQPQQQGQDQGAQPQGGMGGGFDFMSIFNNIVDAWPKIGGILTNIRDLIGQFSGMGQSQGAAPQGGDQGQ